MLLPQFGRQQLFAARKRDKLPCPRWEKESSSEVKSAGSFTAKWREDEDKGKEH
jgi:hypothetical protein